MIEFRPILPGDLSSIRSCVPQGVPLNCDLGFANMVGWSFVYNTEVAFCDDLLFVRFYVNDQLVYMPPIGKGDYNEAFKMLQEDAESLGKPLIMFGVLKKDAKILENNMPGYFRLLPDRDVSDYIYLRSDLSELKGKKLQPKRNHANRFAAQYPDYRYVNLTDDIVSDCLKMENRWLEAKSGKERQTIENERKMVQYVLNHLKELDIIGGALYVGDEIVAFTFGSMINDVTFDVCVEKANPDFEGSYAMINKEFCSHLPEGFIYINREEDLGIEGLRKAKLSYQPKMIMEKLTAIPICIDSHCWEVKRLYQLSFDDDSSFVKFYFSHRYSFENTVTESRDGRIVSAMQILDYSIDIWDNMFDVGYLSAACTLEGYRGKGIMTELLKKTHQKIYNDGKSLSALIPANDGLWNYYGKLGYAPCFKRSTSRFLTSDFEKNGNDNITILGCEDLDVKLYDFFSKKMRERKNYLQHDISDFSTIVDFYNTFGGVASVAMRNETIVGLVFAEKDIKDNHLLKVEECLYDDDYILHRLLENACRDSQCDIAEYPANSSDNSTRKGMIRIINAKEVLVKYAESNSDRQMSFRLVDDSVCENNFCCKMNDGQCQFYDCVESDEYEKISISDLAVRLFGDLYCRMTLMID